MLGRENKQDRFMFKNGLIGVNRKEKVIHFCQNSSITFPTVFPREGKVAAADGAERGAE